MLKQLMRTKVKLFITLARQLLKYPLHNTRARSPPSETDALQSQVSDCLDAVASWMAANRLQLNHSKTDALCCSSTRRQHQILTRPVRVGDTSVQPVVVVRNLGIQFDADVTMRSHVTATVFMLRYSATDQ